MMRALALAAAAAALPSLAAAAAATVEPSPYGAGPVFAAYQVANLSAALDAAAVGADTGGARAWRVRTGFFAAEWTRLEVAATAWDRAPAWTLAVSDGRTEFHAGGDGPLAWDLPGGNTYALTLDMLAAPRSATAPTLMAAGATWDASVTVGAAVEPLCTLALQQYAWAGFGDASTASASFRARSAGGEARLVEVDVWVSGPAGTVTLEVDDGAGSWTPLGQAAVAGSAGAPALVTLRADRMHTVPANGLPLRVAAQPGGALLVAAQVPPQPAAAPTDGVYAWSARAADGSDVRLVGSLRSVLPCRGQGVEISERTAAAMVTTPSTSRAVRVKGWDPTTVAISRMSVYVSTVTDTRTFVNRAFPDLLTVQDSVQPGKSFCIRQACLPVYTKAEHLALRYEIARALKIVDTRFSDAADAYDSGDPTALEGLVSVWPTVAETGATGSFFGTMCVGLTTTVSINNFMSRIQTFLAEKYRCTMATEMPEDAVRIDTIFYALPNTDIDMFGKFQADQVRSYLASLKARGGDTSMTSAGGAVKAYGDPVAVTDGDFKPAPPLRWGAAYATSIASLLWAALLAGLSVSNRVAGGGALELGGFKLVRVEQ